MYIAGLNGMYMDNEGNSVSERLTAKEVCIVVKGETK